MWSKAVLSSAGVSFRGIQTRHEIITNICKFQSDLKLKSSYAAAAGSLNNVDIVDLGANNIKYYFI